jgi:hypothetical protein
MLLQELHASLQRHADLKKVFWKACDSQMRLTTASHGGAIITFNADRFPLPTFRPELKVCDDGHFNQIAECLELAKIGLVLSIRRLPEDGGRIQFPKRFPKTQ